MADFGTLLADAAKAFRTECAASAQISSEGKDLKIRVQAQGMSQKIGGEAEWGEEPKGFLFYNSAGGDFQTQQHDFRVKKHQLGEWVTLQVEFFQRGTQNSLARFIARVDTSARNPNPTSFKPPTMLQQHSTPDEQQVVDEGKRSDDEAASPGTIIRYVGNSRLHILLGPIRKRVFFDSAWDEAIDKKQGLLYFKDIDNLESFVDKTRIEAVFATPYIIYFSLEGKADVVVGRFISEVPMVIGTFDKAPQTTWRDYDPEHYVYDPKEEEDRAVL